MKIKTKKLVVANWKANPSSLKDAKRILSGIRKAATKATDVEVVVCPSILHLLDLKKTQGRSRVILGAQDMFTEEGGAFTGEVGYEALLEAKIKYVIVGHSEMRDRGETDEDISKKMDIILRNGLSPILCIGERSRDGAMEYLGFLKNQLVQAFKNVPKASVPKIVIAYEPIWAIGNSAKRSATPEEIKEVTIFIKRVIGDLYATKSIPPVRILYGGSVSAKDVAFMMSAGGIDGFLVGRASLDVKEFEAILNISNEKNTRSR